MTAPPVAPVQVAGAQPQQLAFTGTQIGGFVAAGAGLVLAGLVFLVSARRRGRKREAT